MIEELTGVKVSSKEAQLIVGEEGGRVREEEKGEIEVRFPPIVGQRFGDFKVETSALAYSAPVPIDL